MWWWLVSCATEGLDRGKDEPQADTGDDDQDTGSVTDTGSHTGSLGTGEDRDGDTFAEGVDCDDADPTVFPGAPDVCGDDRVTDCRRTSDDGLITVDGGITVLTLSSAFAAASAGSVVLVCPGEYVGPSTATVPLTLVSHAGRARTTLDGDGAGTTLTVAGGSTVTGFTIRGGRASSGGGVRLGSPGALTVADSVIRDNFASLSGGGLYAVGAAVDLTGTVVSGNTATEMGGGVALEDASLVGGEIVGNQGPQTQSRGGGGGVYLSGMSSLTGTRVADNHATDGGGISVVGHYRPTEVALVDVTVETNTSVYGGGLWISGAPVTLSGATVIRANEAQEGGGANLGDGASLTGGTLTDNEANDGGGIWIANSALSGTAVVANRALGAGGGVGPSGVVALDGVLIQANTAPNGAGIGSEDPWVRVEVNGGSIVENRAQGQGGGLLVRSDLTLDGVRVSDNVAASGGGLWLADGTTRMVGATVVARNTASLAPWGGGAYLDSAQGSAPRLESVSADWAEGADDNGPDDVRVGGAGFGYGAEATFSCTRSGCAP